MKIFSVNQTAANIQENISSCVLKKIKRYSYIDTYRVYRFHIFYFNYCIDQKIKKNKL